MFNTHRSQYGLRGSLILFAPTLLHLSVSNKWLVAFAILVSLILSNFISTLRVRLTSKLLKLTSIKKPKKS